MKLTRHITPDGPRWAADGRYLRPDFEFRALLTLPASEVDSRLNELLSDESASDRLAAPIEPNQEVWASGVTYLSSRMAREAESETADVYQKVYNAARPELFFKANGWRVRGPEEPIRIRPDSSWDVPEPELALLLNNRGEILGYTVGNDVSSRSIEGENPLYLPQAKVYDGSCALGPCIQLCAASDMRDLPIVLSIERAGQSVFQGETRSSQIKRKLEDLAAYLFRDLSFPTGAFLLTGTGVVPGSDFTLKSGDLVSIAIDQLTLRNSVE